MNNSTFTLGQIPMEPPLRCTSSGTQTTSLSPMYVMAEHLFTLGHQMLIECKSTVHTNYPDMDSYHKDCEIKWKRAIELINMAEKMIKY
jgi:hypothetical protein